MTDTILVDQAKIVVLENVLGKEQTFLQVLYERAIWDTSLFWKCHDAINCLAAELSGNSLIEKSLAGNIASIYSSTLGLVGAHVEADDAFSIENFDQVSS